MKLFKRRAKTEPEPQPKDQEVEVDEQPPEAVAAAVPAAEQEGRAPSDPSLTAD